VTPATAASEQPPTLVPPTPRWILPPRTDPSDIARLEEELALPRALCAVLAARGISTVEAAKDFLRPKLQHLHPADALLDASAAAHRIARAIERGERILVHGDYDVDGVSGAALLTRWIERLGGDARAFVPHRLEDGYDFGAKGLAAAIQAGARVIVTVDCGIVASAAVADATSHGIDVVVTDHHTPGSELPGAVAVVNPNRVDCDYENKGLCGTAVAFKVCELLADWFGVHREELVPYLDFVALASIADLVPLTGENRVLARFGLRALERTRNPGLRALIEATGLDGGRLEAGQVGFVLAPPINAVGRLADAKLALQLLLTEAPDEARAMAQTLLDHNRQRREEDRRTLAQATEMLVPRFLPDRDLGVVLSREGWHPGVIGIVASRLVERIHRPVVMIAMDGERGRGSARSVPGFDLYEAIHACGFALERYGGHRMAAGLEIRASRVAEFSDAFNREVRARLSDDARQPVLRADAEVSIQELDDRLYELLRYVGPFGVGNPRPVFMAKHVDLRRPPRVVGNGHLKLLLEETGTVREAIGFGLAHRVAPESLRSGPVDLLFQLRRDSYQGRVSLQLRLKDVVRSGEAPVG
jgi:single-stranded-DNA-specific exonuclease